MGTRSYVSSYCFYAIRYDAMWYDMIEWLYASDKPGTGAVYSFDPVGSYERETCRAAGAASALIQPFLDNQVSYMFNSAVSLPVLSFISQFIRTFPSLSFYMRWRRIAISMIYGYVRWQGPEYPTKSFGTCSLLSFFVLWLGLRPRVL